MKPVGASSKPRRAKHSHEAAPIALLVLAILTLTAGRARAGLSNSAAANTATLPLPASPAADAQSPAAIAPPPASEPTDQQGAPVMPSPPVALPGTGGNPPNFDSYDNPDIGSYVSQGTPLYSPQIHSLQEFENEGSNTLPLGISVEEGQRKLKSGRVVDGLLVIDVQAGSPAAKAGLCGGHQVAHDVIEGAVVAAAMFFPPAVLAVPVIESVQLGENFDLIIGIDGERVTNFIDFEDRLRDAEPGEVVYLSVVRGGKRLQVPVTVPVLASH